MPLIKDGAFAEDPFVRAADDAPLTDAPTIVSYARFAKERDTLLARNAPLGIRLKPADNPEALGDDVHHFTVVELEFPSFSDGRGFSWARILRTRMHYKGEVRSVGHTIYDQLPLLHRVGVNAFEVPEGFTIEKYNRALGEMTNVYQPSADGRKTIRDLRAG
ncbi:MAG TPA: DUF934 domain-containing protein [Rhizomicrobium sp.]|jgi:uncharacterized protein (DUF934 family)|nr:DUF934 domain-containing protein [Rhizomicrobium sp.]